MGEELRLVTPLSGLPKALQRAAVTPPAAGRFRLHLADLPVGRVAKIDRNRGELDPDIFVEPVVDFDNLVYVKALRWPPITNPPKGSNRAAARAPCGGSGTSS